MTAVDILISSALPARFRGLFKNIRTDSPVQKAFMDSCFEVAETQLRGETRPSLSPLLRALKRRQYGLLAVLGCIIRDKVVSYNTDGQIYQSSLRSH